MFNRIQKTSFGLFVAALSMTALATQDGVSLKRIAKVGDTIKYRLKADIQSDGQEANFSTLVTEKILKVEESGNYVVESVQTGSKVTTPDRETAMADERQTFTYKANGEVVEIKAETVNANVYRTAVLQSFVISDKPVKVGDTWTTESKKDDKTGALAVKGTYKVDGEEKVGQFETLRIKFVNKEVEGGEAAPSHDATAWVDKKDGSIVKSEGVWKNFPFPGAITPVSAKYVLIRE
jgi:hypothetical protein